MQQLSGLDATFLNLETTRAPLHIAGLAVYDQSTAPGELVTFKAILRNIEQRLHLARCFRQKLVRTPLGFDHPYWLEDADFDLEFHVRHIALPKPGDWRQLCIQAARIHARPLDLTKPLWEMYVIEGLDGVDGLPPDSFALLTKIHHAAIDGMSGVELTAAIHDLAVDAEPPAATERWRPEPEPTSIELALRSIANNIRQPLRFAGVVSELAPPAIRALWERREVPEGAGDEVPRTRFNEPVTAHRVFEARTFVLDQIKQIRKSVDGATVNDVVLSVCGGALRRYLTAHGELPSESLSTFAPISVRTESERGTAGNQVSGMFVTLHTDEPDPIRRLERVHATTRQSKHLSDAIGARHLTDLTQFMPGALAGIAGRLVAQTGLMSRLAPVANTVVTNVPGPQVPLYFTGARMVTTFGMGLPMDGLGLFHVVFSYAGTLTISITACRDQVPDPAFYAECLQAAFDELLTAAVA